MGSDPLYERYDESHYLSTVQYVKNNCVVTTQVWSTDCHAPNIYTYARKTKKQLDVRRKQNQLGTARSHAICPPVYVATIDLRRLQKKYGLPAGLFAQLRAVRRK